MATSEPPADREVPTAAPVSARCESCRLKDALVVVALVEPGRGERRSALCGDCYVGLGLAGRAAAR